MAPFFTFLHLTHTTQQHLIAHPPPHTYSTATQKMSTDNLKYRSFLSETSHEEQSRILTGPAKFELTYFNFTCIGATPRYLLAYAKADWVDNQIDPNTFDEEQAHDLPFGVTPVLKVQPKEGDGEVIRDLMPSLSLPRLTQIILALVHP